METHLQLVWLQGFSVGFLYYDRLMDDDYDLDDYPIDYEERYQFMFGFFGLIITRWYEEY